MLTAEQKIFYKTFTLNNVYRNIIETLNILLFESKYNCVQGMGRGRMEVNEMGPHLSY